jgi:effector-binding domain-containing protein
VWTAVRAQDAKGGRHVAVYRNLTTVEDGATVVDALQIEVGVELLGPFVEQGDVVCSALPAGLVASTPHFGAYSGLGAAHDAIREWCAANNLPLAGLRWEIYGHWQREWDSDPSLIRTDVFYSIAQ